MANIVLVRTGQELPDKQALEGVRTFLFQCFDGLSAADKKAWRRFWAKLVSMEPGELSRLECVIPRNARFHFKFFALLNVGFDAWEPGRKRKTYKGFPVQKDFEQFREDVTIAAGHFTQTFGLNGKFKLKAKSISFASMDDAEFERVYSSVANVLLAGVLFRYAGRDELDQVVDKIIGFL